MDDIRDIILKYNTSGPRYTSYPPATFFHENVTHEDFLKCVEESNIEGNKNISLYIHIPFCNERCHFCGCNTELGCKNSEVTRYLECLKKEIETVSKLIDKSRLVTQIHWGGGTPNYLDISQIEDIMSLIKSLFTYSENIEIAIECNPAYLDFSYAKGLANIGFNRISLGIQDFDNEILKLVNRKPSKLPVKALIRKLKDLGFLSVNIDLIYGLPNQTVDSFLNSVKQALKANPDRLVTFSYAHMPALFKMQEVLENYNLPSANEKLDMLLASCELILSNGYKMIGIDHYAKSEDDLSKAIDSKQLHRNFQGYCTKETTGQVYAFGSSGISQLNNSYFQNTKSVKGYIKNITESGGSIQKGYVLSSEDVIVRKVINSIMCNGYVDFNIIAKNFNLSIIDLYNLLGFNEVNLDRFINDGLLGCSSNVLDVSGIGFFVLRNIAMLFDPKLNKVSNSYSKTI